ncbi:class F sortase [Candidatus Saccharibacteria bacterium]|nr:class F sortase [Candidatus Saccharibacteria bacterium]
MALRFNWKKNLPRIIWCAILLVLGLCLIKTAVWEANYYAGKEGSTRATTKSTTNAPIDTSEDVDESAVTEQMKQAWKVAADKPRFLSIPKLNIDRARVLEIGLNNTGRLLTPNNIFDVGWYRASSKPGAGGTLLIDGHNGGPHIEGVFKHLPDLEIGDLITIERGDGKFFRYKVVENEEVPLSEADGKMSKMLTSPESGKESLSLITCSGVWSGVQQTYLSRQFVRAVIVEENTNFEKTELKNELQEKRDKAKEENKEENS